MVRYQKTPTKFQFKVYEALLQIPPGKVTTYAELAKKIGCASAIAVGQALKRNPYAPFVPCHRVITSAKTLGGYNGKTEGENVQRKLELLTKEGVSFFCGKLTDDTCLFQF